MLGTLGTHGVMKKRIDVTVWQVTAFTVPAISECLTGRAVRGP